RLGRDRPAQGPPRRHCARTGQRRYLRRRGRRRARAVPGSRDLANALNGSQERHRPGLAEVGRAVYKHGQYLVDHFEDEFYGVRDLRKHIAWYFKGYPVGGELRSQLAMVSSLDELAGLLSQLDQD